ncbi:hypothetical protein M5K25_023812 [Dendrobium thyrsiflorum]|uniref:Uncharacterized protein n=1 Tax=Dendrobium thyrsiflorum TaxID=117978 RepID=A0ABD0U0P2_DENTH
MYIILFYKFNELIVKLSGSELRTQRRQNRPNPSPNESRSSPRSADRRFKTQFGLPNGLQIIQSYSRIERLDETNPTSLRSRKSDICRSRYHSSNHPRSRGSISADPRLKESKETQDRSCTLAPPRPPPDHQQKALHFAGPPPDHQPKALYSAGPPAEGPTLRRTTAGPPAEGHTLRRTTTGPPAEGPILRRTTAGPPVEGPSLRRRTEGRYLLLVAWGRPLELELGLELEAREP